MKEPDRFLGKTNLTQFETQDLVMHTSEPASIRESTEIVVKILNSNYSRYDIDEVSVNAVQLYTNQSEKLLGLLK